MRGLFVVVLILAFALAYSIAAESQINSEAQDLFGNNDEIGVIVVLKDDYSLLQQYGISNYNNDNFEMKKMMINEQQEKVLSDLKIKKKNRGVSVQADENYDFELTNSYTTVNGFAGKLKKSSYQKLKNNPKVLGVYNQRNISFSLGNSAGIINATRTWGLIYSGTNITGKGESVCVIDTGVDYTHPALGSCSSSSFTGGTCSKVINGYDFVNNDNDPVDDHGHGTHVAGIVASTESSIRGIAPDSNIVAMKVLDSNGFGTDSNLISAIDWCTNNASKFNISVISMSLGTPDYFNSTYCDSSQNPLIVDSIHNAISKNISVIVAAGNDGAINGVSSPACIANVTVVGSTAKNDSISSFSDTWGLPMLLAPGSSIKSLKASVGCLCGNCQGDFMTCSGTSMATPHVAAAFALLHQYRRLEQNMILNPLQIQNALNSTGKLINDSGFSNLIYSRINIFSALLSLDTTAPDITFVNPTPPNNSKISKNFVFINITSNEVLSNITLEWNGTNETMEGNALNWFKNKTRLSNINATYSYRVFANDSAGNMKSTELRFLTINNSAPVITSFAPNVTILSISEPINEIFNITYEDIDNDLVSITWYQNGSIAAINSNYSLGGNFTSAGDYNITIIVFDGNLSNFVEWAFTISDNNQIPTITSASLTNTDFLKRTNGTLQAFWSFNDFDSDNITLNETLWYINNTLNSSYTNKTMIDAANTTKLENWTFSVRVFDGKNWSDFANSSTIRILNSKPSISITTLSINILETQLANISLNASDLDNDPLAFTVNKSEFILSNNALLWYTDLASSGIYSINVTVNDSSDIDSAIVNVTVIDARDLDNDGNPDYNDTDIDNDGIANQADFLEGNLQSINTALSLNLTLNGQSNLSGLFNGTFTVNITNGSDEIMEFEFTFNASNVLDLGNLTINRTTNGSSAVSIRGLNLSNSTKTIFLEKINATVKSVCIKDADTGFDAITSACDGASETLITCDNATNGQYTCFDTGTRYKITGLSHSAVKEECRDNDGDGYGVGCSLGNDCNDNDRSKTTDCSSPSSGGGSSGGGGGGGSSGGGGGGGGGGSAGFVCNMDWKCSEWSACINSLQTRQCDFMKVQQHVSDAQCPDSVNSPATTKKCEVPKTTELKSETCNDGLKNQDEEGTVCGGVCKPCEEKNLNSQGIVKNDGTNQLTGFAVRDILGKGSNIAVALVSIAIVAVISILGFRFYRRRKQIQQ